METCSMTDAGVIRGMNQDYFFSSEEPVGNLPTLFIVADGMGGHTAGEFASRYTVEKIIDSVSKDSRTDVSEILTDAVLSANQQLIDYAGEHEDMRGMGTTVVAAVVSGKRLFVANVGDSRLYIVNKNIHQVTRDHSLVEEMVRMGEINEEQARNHPDKNIITRAVGAEADLRVDLFDVRISKGDLILLCTDGLTNMVEDSVLYEILTDPGADLTGKVQKLIDTANQNGGRDNITVIAHQT